MRSPTGVVASLAILLSLPLAVVLNTVFGVDPETILHFVIGGGFLLFAVSIFSFEVPRWLNWIGAIAAAAFGSIFILQGVSDVLGGELLHSIAFGTLGHEVERVLPDVIFVWFVGLLFAASRGKSRIMGGVVMAVTIGIEVATVASVLLGVDLPMVKLAYFLPFAWLLVESLKSAPFERDNEHPETRQVIGTSVA